MRATCRANLALCAIACVAHDLREAARSSTARGQHGTSARCIRRRAPTNILTPIYPYLHTRTQPLRIFHHASQLSPIDLAYHTDSSSNTMPCMGLTCPNRYVATWPRSKPRWEWRRLRPKRCKRRPSSRSAVLLSHLKQNTNSCAVFTIVVFRCVLLVVLASSSHLSLSSLFSSGSISYVYNIMLYDIMHDHMSLCYNYVYM